jgi:predicted RNase H-like HicB family nuclease
VAGQVHVSALILFSPSCTVYGADLLFNMNRHYTAVIKRDGAWWIGWVDEIPGVNCQGKTRAELQKNLRSALKEALELNRDDQKVKP